jgi:Ala-tRNA(Pro) deacylase
MPVKEVQDLLNSHHIKYAAISHSPAYTAQEIAAKAHIPGKEMAKTVIVKIDGEMAMTVIPANYQVDFEQLKNLTGATNVELAIEEEFKYNFPECEIGAMPPFGNLYNMDTYVAESLAEDENICFNAGSHHELIKLAFKDWENIVHPKKLKFSVIRH